MNKQLTLDEVKDKYPFAYELYRSLPETLSKEEILKANSKKHDISFEREYFFDDMKFVIPPNVFEPGGTSENIFRKIQSGEIDIENKVIAVMGCGAGVEAVLIAKKNPKAIYAFDIDEGSIKATRTNFDKYITDKGLLREYTSDLFDELEENIKSDLILFNPPAVSVPISENLDVIRNTSIGTTIVTRFFDVIKNRNLLSNNGEVIITFSNTAELKKIISYALRLGFVPQIKQRITYDKPYEKIQTLIFSITFI
jgi:release factor glutamine methyltransferase